jgi:threonine aldolase
MAAEAVVVFRNLKGEGEDAAEADARAAAARLELRRRRKRAGHELSKMRFVGAQ